MGKRRSLKNESRRTETASSKYHLTVCVRIGLFSFMAKKLPREHTLSSSWKSICLRRRLGVQVRIRRNMTGLSLAKLGKEIGISAPQLYNIESGHSFPSFVVYAALLEKFGLSPPALTAKDSQRL